jgi:hypothetical protein
MQLQQPNIVGNFLNAYQSGLERQEAQKEAERQRLRQDRSDQRSDQQFQWQMDDRQLQDAMRRKETLARAAMALDTPEKWTAGAPQVMRELGMDGEVPGFDQRDRIISESMTIGDQLEQQWKERGYRLDEMRTVAQVRASNAAAAASSRRGGVSNELIDNEAKVRGEYTGQLKEFVNVRDAFGRVAAAAEDPSAAGDLALIFNYMKMLDPGSVVREQEFANAQNAASVPERVRAAYNNALRGERLTDATRGDFLDRAGRLFSTQLDTANKTREVYGSLADQYGFSRDRVTPDLSLGVTTDIIRPKAAPTFTGSGLLGGSGVNYTPPAQPSVANESTSQLYERADKLLRGIK